MTTKISSINSRTARDVVRLYLSLYPEKISDYSNLTQKQVKFYGLNELKDANKVISNI